MTDKEMEQQIVETVRAAIAAHPGASAEAIADILAGPQSRDPREVAAGARELVRVVISDLGATDDDDDTVVKVALAAVRDCGVAEMSALAWLGIRRVARKQLGTPGRRR
jgi:hypothetical protein